MPQPSSPAREAIRGTVPKLAEIADTLIYGEIWEGPHLSKRDRSLIDLGPTAVLDLGGIAVVVVSQRVQCADPAFFEAFGLDIAAARVVVVKSRGHFRGGFDEFFAHEQVIEVDAPGLTSPILGNFAWKHLPRPVLPIDTEVDWVPPDA